MPSATATVRVEVDEPVIDDGDSVGVNAGSEDEAVSETAPVNERIGVRLIVDVPELPAITVNGSGLAESVKSGPMTRMSRNAECVRDGEELVPFTSKL